MEDRVNTVAKILTKRLTDAEIKLWKHLRTKHIKGYRVRSVVKKF